jgi:processive 1,2-diacylglycerol beta-glucosyltransferase
VAVARVSAFYVQAMRALLVGARMGAGHNGVARELAQRIDERRGTSVVVDFLDAVPRPLAAMWQQSYRAQLRWAPGSYEASYRRQYERREQWDRFVRWERRLTERTVTKWVEQHRPDVVISTYSFATQVLSSMRTTGDLTAPVVNVFTDFGVHPLLVHPGVDLHLAAHQVVVDQARRFTDRPIALAGPAVRREFQMDVTVRLARRLAVRAELGVSDGETVVLVLTGSWGVGSSIATTVGSMIERPGTTVVTVCGRDGRLARELRAHGLGTVIGWTDDVAGLIAACDVVVENAGGLSAMESFAAGRPVITHRVIPGHGRDNAAAMALAGLSTVTDNEFQLRHHIDRVGADPGAFAHQVAGGLALFDHDPVDQIAHHLDLG